MLPNELLNARNRDLKERVSAIQSDIAKIRQFTYRDKEELHTTTEKVTDARTKLASIQSSVDKTSLITRDEQERVSSYTSEIDKLTKNIKRCGDETKDLSQKLESLEGMFRQKKAQRDAAEEEREALEQRMITWTADNAVSGQMTEICSSELKIKESNIRSLHVDVRNSEAAVREQEELIWEETLATEQINADIRGAKQQIGYLDKEKKDMIETLKQLNSREQAAHDAYVLILKEKESTEEMIRIKREEMGELTRELTVAEAELHQTAKAKERAEKKKSAISLTMKQTEHSEREEEIRCEEMERSLQLTNNELETLKKQKKHLLGNLTNIREKSSKLEKKATEMREVLQDSEKASQDNKTDDNTIQMNKLLEKLKEESMELDSAIIRGKNLEAQQRQIQMRAAEETDVITNQLMYLQKQVKLSRKKESKFKDSFHKLYLADEAISAHLEELQRQLSTEEAMRSGASMEMRKAHYAHISKQKALLGELDKMLLKSRVARDEAVGLLRTEGRSLEALKDSLVTMKKEEEDLNIEIRALARETQELYINKQEIGSTAEGLLWEVEQQQHVLEDHHGSIVEQLHHKALLEKSIREKEIRIKSEMDGSLVTLHAHQENNRKMGAKLNAITHQLTLLKARHDDIMAALTRKVYKNDMDDDSLSKGNPARNMMLLGNNGLMMITDKTTSSKTPTLSDMPLLSRPVEEDKLISLESTTPEELQARMMIKRAIDRQILQERGDKLDMEIVKAERDLRQLTVANERLEHTIKHGRDMIVLHGVPYDEVLYSRVCDTDTPPLLITNGEDNVDDVTPIDSVQVEEDEEVQKLKNEVNCWDSRISQLNSLLLQRKEEDDFVRGICASEQCRLDEAIHEKTALSRHLDDLNREIAKDTIEMEKTRAAALQKQLQFIKHNPSRVVAAAVGGGNTGCQKGQKARRSIKYVGHNASLERGKIRDIYSRLMNLVIRSSCRGHSSPSVTRQLPSNISHSLGPTALFHATTNKSGDMNSSTANEQCPVKTDPMSPFMMLQYLSEKYGIKEVLGVGGHVPTSTDRISIITDGVISNKHQSYKATLPLPDECPLSNVMLVKGVSITGHKR